MVHGAGGDNGSAKWIELCTSQITSHDCRNSKVFVIAPVGRWTANDAFRNLELAELVISRANPRANPGKVVTTDF